MNRQPLTWTPDDSEGYHTETAKPALGITYTLIETKPGGPWSSNVSVGTRYKHSTRFSWPDVTEDGKPITRRTGTKEEMQEHCQTHWQGFQYDLEEALQ